MESFNWWGAFSFVMPIAVTMIIGLMIIIAFILARIAKLINSLGGNHGRVKLTSFYSFISTNSKFSSNLLLYI